MKRYCALKWLIIPGIFFLLFFIPCQSFGQLPPPPPPGGSGSGTGAPVDAGAAGLVTAIALYSYSKLKTGSAKGKYAEPAGNTQGL